jgi:hypothetical protein
MKELDSLLRIFVFDDWFIFVFDLTGVLLVLIEV